MPNQIPSQFPKSKCASKLSGDHAGDVAKYKGEVESIETAQIKNGCKKLKI